MTQTLITDSDKKISAEKVVIVPLSKNRMFTKNLNLFYFGNKLKYHFYVLFSREIVRTILKISFC